mmetsp:Transcript_30528/g.35584  ORF Transcript_30528/g.35584 Transcript_30528/m.35584 type:complete len:199 (+) Transcript_30528:170-766(+)
MVLEIIMTTTPSHSNITHGITTKPRKGSVAERIAALQKQQSNDNVTINNSKNIINSGRPRIACNNKKVMKTNTTTSSSDSAIFSQRMKDESLPSSKSTRGTNNSSKVATMVTSMNKLNMQDILSAGKRDSKLSKTGDANCMSTMSTTFVKGKDDIKQSDEQIQNQGKMYHIERIKIQRGKRRAKRQTNIASVKFSTEA